MKFAPLVLLIAAGCADLRPLYLACDNPNPPPELADWQRAKLESQGGCGDRECDGYDWIIASERGERAAMFLFGLGLSGWVGTVAGSAAGESAGRSAAEALLNGL